MRKVVAAVVRLARQLAVVEAPDLEPAPGQVVIDVEAAGVNFVDGLIVEGRYQVKPPLPYTPGTEVAGDDRARSVTAVDGLAVGERVARPAGRRAATPRRSPCRRRRPCRSPTT